MTGKRFSKRVANQRINMNGKRMRTDICNEVKNKSINCMYNKPHQPQYIYFILYFLRLDVEPVEQANIVCGGNA